MIKQHILLTYRNFKRFKNSFFINLIGLSTGLACTMLIYLWVNAELEVNGFHENDARLYQVMAHQQYAQEIMTTQSTPGLLAEGLKDEFPEIEFAATTTWIDDNTLSFGDLNIQARGYHVGPDYFQIFSYPIIQGDPATVLADKGSIVISDELAIKLFGTKENVIGKKVDWQHDRTFLVSGIFEKVPTSSFYQFDFVLSFEVYKDSNDWVLDWGNNGPSTFVVLHKGADQSMTSDKISQFIKTKHEDSHVTLFLQSFSERYLYSRYENGVQTGGRIEYVALFSIIAVFILIIACINFMNLSTARASRRAKEVGIKKAVGAPRKALISQFLTEAMAMTIVSVILSLVMVALFLPEFNEITDKKIALEWDLNLIITLLVVTVFTGLVSGSYPAIYLAAFQPVKVLKGEIKGSIGELWARRGLVIFQFSLSILLIISVLVVFRQIEYVQNKNLGYNKDNVLYFSIEGKLEKHLDTFIERIKEIPGVVAASSMGHSFTGQQTNTYNVVWEGKNPYDKILFEQVRVNYDMIETIGVEMKEGRPFSREFGADSARIIFNEAAIKIMGLEDPVGKKVKIWGDSDMEIVGVAKDFHFQSLHEQVSPLFFVLSPENTWNVMVRVQAGQEKNTLEALKQSYESFNNGFTFNYDFLDEQYQVQYAAEQRVSLLSRYFAGFAILISCLGLFGLAAFTAERRLKEIGIRKVLGSSVMNIIYLLTSDFTKMVMIAIVITLPISYLLIKNWLDRFAYRITLDIWFFAGAGILALLIAWITVSYQAIRAAHINPAECLRDE